MASDDVLFEIHAPAGTPALDLTEVSYFNEVMFDSPPCFIEDVRIEGLSTPCIVIRLYASEQYKDMFKTVNQHGAKHLTEEKNAGKSNSDDMIINPSSGKQRSLQDNKWNTEYMPLVKANIRQSVQTYFSKYVSQEKMERCLDSLGFMDQAELRRRYEERGRRMSGDTLGYNDGESSNIAIDMNGITKGGQVGNHRISGSGGFRINYAFVTAVHENLHMMSANDRPPELRRGLMVGNDEKSRAMNEAFTEYFTFISCGGEKSLGGVYPGRYSLYHELMQEMPIIESAVGRDCMMDAYFNNNPQRIRSKIDSMLEPGAWDAICNASYDLIYNGSANDGANRLQEYLLRLRKHSN